jgi:hypothetical protein
MGVTLRKDVHRWVRFVEEDVTFCRNCGTVMDNGQTPFSDACTVLHDYYCVCDKCRAIWNG